MVSFISTNYRLVGPYGSTLVQPVCPCALLSWRAQGWCTVKHPTFHILTIQPCRAAPSTLPVPEDEVSSLLRRTQLSSIAPTHVVASARDRSKRRRSKRSEAQPLCRTTSHVVEDYPFGFVHDFVERLRGIHYMCVGQSFHHLQIGLSLLGGFFERKLFLTGLDHFRR